jgi:hypothetical protein
MCFNFGYTKVRKVVELTQSLNDKVYTVDESNNLNINKKKVFLS